MGNPDNLKRINVSPKIKKHHKTLLHAYIALNVIQLRFMVFYSLLLLDHATELQEYQKY